MASCKCQSEGLGTEAIPRRLILDRCKRNQQGKPTSPYINGSPAPHPAFISRGGDAAMGVDGTYCLINNDFTGLCQHQLGLFTN